MQPTKTMLVHAALEALREPVTASAIAKRLRVSRALVIDVARRSGMGKKLVAYGRLAARVTPAGKGRAVAVLPSRALKLARLRPGQSLDVQVSPGRITVTRKSNHRHQKRRS